MSPISVIILGISIFFLLKATLARKGVCLDNCNDRSQAKVVYYSFSEIRFFE